MATIASIDSHGLSMHSALCFKARMARWWTMFNRGVSREGGQDEGRKVKDRQEYV